MATSMDLSETRQPSLYASSTIPFVFAVACVGSRFWCRWTNKAGFWLDDWLILFALICAIGLTTNMLWWIPRGLGKHVLVFGPHVAELFNIGLFTAEMTYTGVIISVKFSIAALYQRIFRTENIKLPIIILSALVAMWGIAVFLLTLLQCIPTRGFWDKTIERSCNVDSNKFLFAISIPNILIDVALLLLPVPFVLKLHVSKDRKVSIMSMFLLGGFVCVASIMRLLAVVNEDLEVDPTWNLVDQGIWAKMEADFAIISACLPTLRPLYVAIRTKLFGTVPSHGPSCPQEGGSVPRKKRALQSWGMSALQSRDEDTTLFARVDKTDETDSHDASLSDTQKATVVGNTSLRCSCA
ncbi:unnamed protein product [Clonostachys chloroleuca]|uniref:Rhodopsin domain-containing protein n=2 Tax=Clonostachys TaxID=110564 RepID=A0AA35QGF2_9HYPO|nr:unnamed protein product [Clonostachys chloroleuca]